MSPGHLGSLKVRLEQEYQLLEHAWERPWFGWGRFGRGRIYDEAGSDITISDGYWVITVGTFGLVGFFAQFGMLGLPVFRAARAHRVASTQQEAVYLGALSLIVAINMIDLLPNSSLSPWTWLLAGALLGRAEQLSAVRSPKFSAQETRLLLSRPTA